MQFADFFSFNKFLAPVLIKFVYWGGLALIALSTLVSVAGMSLVGRYDNGGGAGKFLLVLLLAILSAVIWRVLCELWIVIFSINDRLGVLSGQPGKSPELSQ